MKKVTFTHLEPSFLLSPNRPRQSSSACQASSSFSELDHIEEVADHLLERKVTDNQNDAYNIALGFVGEGIKNPSAYKEKVQAPAIEYDAHRTGMKNLASYLVTKSIKEGVKLAIPGGIQAHIATCLLRSLATATWNELSRLKDPTPPFTTATVSKKASKLGYALDFASQVGLDTMEKIFPAMKSFPLCRFAIESSYNYLNGKSLLVNSIEPETTFAFEALRPHSPSHEEDARNLVQSLKNYSYSEKTWKHCANTLRSLKHSPQALLTALQSPRTLSFMLALAPSAAVKIISTMLDKKLSPLGKYALDQIDNTVGILSQIFIREPAEKFITTETFSHDKAQERAEAISKIVKNYWGAENAQSKADTPTGDLEAGERTPLLSSSSCAALSSSVHQASQGDFKNYRSSAEHAGSQRLPGTLKRSLSMGDKPRSSEQQIKPQERAHYSELKRNLSTGDRPHKKSTLQHSLSIKDIPHYLAGQIGH